MIYRIIFTVVILTGISASCQYGEEIISSQPGLELQYSEDTISFDTVFTISGSITKRLMILNPNNNAIQIDRIYLGGGTQSEYSIIVAGDEKPEVNGQLIYGEDSLLVLVRVSIDPNDDQLPFIVRDSILFSYNERLDHIKLRSWGQNARYIGDQVISEDQIWTSEIPYFLTGSIVVDSLKTLTIREGVRVYVSNQASIFVKGSLVTEGSSDGRVVFRNERLEDDYENIPGQWGGIFFLEGSRDNRIDFTDIRNSQYGLRIGTPDPDTIPDVIIRNTRIENTSIGGIVAFTSDLWVENSLIDISAGYTLANLAGGNYHYIHCTFANYALGFSRLGPSVIFSNNLLLDDNTLLDEPLHVEFLHSILWGDLKEEILIEDGGNTDFLIQTGNSIFKTSLTNFKGGSSYISTDTDYMIFKDIKNYDYMPDTLAPAIDHAGMSGMKFDLFGQARDSIPDIGAIEFLK
ncbi:MAG: right-handed parallel beta-helix repeat-containing protein [Cyclobacteriaceae bacterium]|nr:right-handed parallel beta-helix repeat-containing protein [Cyclobacteriaceae bacterium]